MIGVPAATDIDQLVGFFSHFGNLWIVCNGGEKTIDVYLAPAFGKGNVLFRRQFLVTDEDNFKICEGRGDIVEFSLGKIPQINVRYLSCKRGADFFNFYDGSPQLRVAYTLISF